MKRHPAPPMKSWPRSRLWAADGQAIETAGKIRPGRIAEIGRAIGECVGAHRKPTGIGQVRAGLHDDDQVAGAGDVESECIPFEPRPVLLICACGFDDWSTTSTLVPVS